MQLQLCIYSFLIVLSSTILNYIYHLCALEVVASGIDDIIVQTERNLNRLGLISNFRLRLPRCGAKAKGNGGSEAG
jgi:hypothetical protein